MQLSKLSNNMEITHTRAYSTKTFFYPLDLEQPIFKTKKKEFESESELTRPLRTEPSPGGDDPLFYNTLLRIYHFTNHNELQIAFAMMIVMTTTTSISIPNNAGGGHNITRIKQTCAI